MNRTPVDSSNIAPIGYDLSTSTLEIEFLNNSIYHYHGVEASTYESLMSASSHGKYLAQHIKGTYKYEQIS